MRPLQIGRLDERVQAVRRVVGDAYRLRLVIEFDHRNDGPEGLGLRKRGTVVNAREYCRLKVKALRQSAAQPLSADKQFTGTGRDGLVDHTEDAINRALTDDRAEYHRRVERVTDRRRFDDGNKLRQECVVN